MNLSRPPELAEQPASPSGLNRAVMVGLSWTAISVGLAKISSLLSQLALGWLLAASDFGLYALAISSAAVVQGWTNGGAEKILVQRGTEYHRLLAPVARLALLFNLLAVVILLAGAPLMAQLFDAADLPLLVAVIALSVPLSTPAVILRAKLTSELQFKTIARVATVSAVIRHLSMVVFALLGFGPLSFVLPLPLIAVYEWIAFSQHAKLWPRGAIATTIRTGEIWKDARWILIASFAGALCHRAHYFVVGLLEERWILGVYFFGSQLSASVFQLLLPGMSGVMLGSFAKLTGNPGLQARGYLKAVRMLSLFVVPLSAAMFFVADAAITLLWSGKWNAAIPVVQILLIVLPARVLSLLSMPLVEAQGRWRLRAALLYGRVVGVTVCAAAGAWMGGLVSIALCIGGFQLASALMGCIVAGRLVQLQARDVLAAMAPPVVVAIISALLAHYAIDVMQPAQEPLSWAMARVAIFFVSFWALTWAALGDRYVEARSSLRLISKRRRRQAEA